MNYSKIIKAAQKANDLYESGYRRDINTEVLNSICEILWHKAVKLGYSFFQWRNLLIETIGVINYNYWDDEIELFLQERIRHIDYYVCLGIRYCC